MSRGVHGREYTKPDDVDLSAGPIIQSMQLSIAEPKKEVSKVDTSIRFEQLLNGSGDGDGDGIHDDGDGIHDDGDGDGDGFHNDGDGIHTMTTHQATRTLVLIAHAVETITPTAIGTAVTIDLPLPMTRIDTVWRTHTTKRGCERDLR